MKPTSRILFLFAFLLAWLGSKAAPSASPPAGSDFPGMGHPLETTPGTPENSTSNTPNPEFPGTVPPEPSKIPHAVFPGTSSPGFTETPTPDLGETPNPERPETPKSDPLTTSLSESLDTTKTNPSRMTHPEPSEIPKPDPTQTPHSDNPKPDLSKALHSEFHEPPNTDAIQTVRQRSLDIPTPNAPEISHAETPGAPTPAPTETSDPTSPGTQDLNATGLPNSELSQTLHPDPTETPHLESRVTHSPSPTEIPQTEFHTIHGQDATETPMSSDPDVTSVYPETPASFKDEATAPHDQPLNPEPEILAATQPGSPTWPTSDSPGTIELKTPQNSDPKGPDALPPSARIAGPSAPPGPPTQLIPATPRAPQRRSRGERVNTIIVVERVKETGVTLVGRPRGAAGGALCLFFAGTGLLIGIFLLLWCLYRRAARHRPFAHHRLPVDGEEPVMHLDAPKDPYDLYFYAPDAWVPSHIATKQPPPTPPLPPKLPPPPRGGRPQRLEALSPATLPNNFV